MSRGLLFSGHSVDIKLGPERAETLLDVAKIIFVDPVTRTRPGSSSDSVRKKVAIFGQTCRCKFLAQDNYVTDGFVKFFPNRIFSSMLCIFEKKTFLQGNVGLFGEDCAPALSLPLRPLALLTFSVSNTGRN